MKINDVLSSKAALRFSGTWNPQESAYLPDVNAYKIGNVLQVVERGTIDGVLYLKDSFIYHDGSKWIPVNNVASVSGIVWDVATNPQLPSSAYPFALMQLTSAGTDSNGTYFSEGDIAVVDYTGASAINVTRINYANKTDELNFFTDNDDNLKTDTTFSYNNIYISEHAIKNRQQVEFELFNLEPFGDSAESMIFGIIESDKTVSDILDAKGLAVIFVLSETQIVLQVVEKGRTQMAIAPPVPVTKDTVFTIAVDQTESEVALSVDGVVLEFTPIFGSDLDLSGFDFSVCKAATYVLTITEKTYSARFSDLEYSFGYPAWSTETYKYNGLIRIVDTEYTKEEYPQQVLGNAVIFARDLEIGGKRYLKGECIFWNGGDWVYLVRVEKSLAVSTTLVDNTIIPYNNTLFRLVGNDANVYQAKNLLRSNYNSLSHYSDGEFNPLVYSHRDIFPEKYFSSHNNLVGDSRRTSKSLNFEYTINRIEGTSDYFGIALKTSKNGIDFQYTDINNLEAGAFALLYDPETKSIDCINPYKFSIGLMEVTAGDVINFVVGESVHDPEGTIPFNQRNYKVGVYLNGVRKAMTSLTQYISNLETDTWLAYPRTFFPLYSYSATLALDVNTGQTKYKYTTLLGSNENSTIENRRDYSGYVFDDRHPLELTTQEAAKSLFANKMAERVLVTLPIEINSINYLNYLDKVIDAKYFTNLNITINTNTPDGFQCVVFQTGEGKPVINYSGVINSYNDLTASGGKGAPITIQKLGGELYLGGVLGEL